MVRIELSLWLIFATSLFSIWITTVQTEASDSNWESTTSSFQETTCTDPSTWSSETKSEITSSSLGAPLSSLSSTGNILESSILTDASDMTGTLLTDTPTISISTLINSDQSSPTETSIGTSAPSVSIPSTPDVSSTTSLFSSILTDASDMTGTLLTDTLTISISTLINSDQSSPTETPIGASDPSVSIPSTPGVSSTFSSNGNLQESSSFVNTDVQSTLGTETLGSSIGSVSTVLTVSTSDVKSTPEISLSATMSDGMPTTSYLPTTAEIPTTSHPVEITTTPANMIRPIEVQYALMSSIEFTENITVLFGSLIRNETDYTGNISSALTTAYSQIRGFMNLIVTGVRPEPHSIKADYNLSLVYYYEEANVHALLSDIREKVIPSLEDQVIISNFMFNKTDFEERIKDETFTENITDPSCDRLVVKCPMGYGCFIHSRRPLCRSLCSRGDKDCGQNGVCSLDSETGEPICRCFESDEFTFSGEFCEEKSEKFALSKGAIIGVGVGTGIALFLVCILVIVFLMFKLRRVTEKRGDSGSESELIKKKVKPGEVELKNFKGRPGSQYRVSGICEMTDLYKGNYSFEDIGEDMSDYPTFNRAPTQGFLGPAAFEGREDGLTAYTPGSMNKDDYCFVEESTLTSNLRRLEPIDPIFINRPMLSTQL